MSRKIKIELIKWLDSCGGMSHWKDPSDIKSLIGGVIFSSGIVMMENNDWIVIVPHYGPENETSMESICGEMHIPKCSIVERKIIYGDEDD